MNEPYLEVRSAIWQKLFILPISLLLCGVGIITFLLPFVPALRTTSLTGPVTPMSFTDVIMAMLMGLFLFALGFCLWWTVIKYSIRADNDGICQTNSFFTQTVRWKDVASYYMKPNRTYYRERRLYIEPVMLDAQEAIIFQGFAHLLLSTKKIIQQRQELWRFVETQLAGKRIEAPSPDLDPQVMAVRSLEVNWSAKSLVWKIGRMIALVCYALFWLGCTMVPMYYVVARNITVPQPWGGFMVLPMFIGPMLPHLIWITLKKRKIIKEMQRRDMAN